MIEIMVAVCLILLILLIAYEEKKRRLAKAHFERHVLELVCGEDEDDEIDDPELLEREETRIRHTANAIPIQADRMYFGGLNGVYGEPKRVTIPVEIEG